MPIRRYQLTRRGHNFERLGGQFHCQRFVTSETAVMTSNEANVPSETTEHHSVLRHCEKCSAMMKQLGELPARSIRAAVRVFRCYACDHVAADRM